MFVTVPVGPDVVVIGRIDSVSCRNGACVALGLQFASSIWTCEATAAVRRVGGGT